MFSDCADFVEKCNRKALMIRAFTFVIELEKEESLSLDLVLKWIHGSLIFLWDSPNLIQKSSERSNSSAGDFHFTES